MGFPLICLITRGYMQFHKPLLLHHCWPINRSSQHFLRFGHGSLRFRSPCEPCPVKTTHIGDVVADATA